MITLLSEIGNTWFLPFENSFILWLQSLGGKGSFIYYIMTFFTLFGEEVLLVAVMAVLYFGIDKVRGEKLGAMLMTTALLTPLIKNIVCRTRPFDSQQNIQNLRDVGGYSFPSGHSSSSAAVFGGTALLYSKQKKWLWSFGIAIPVLVALSRNYLGAHYLTDVVAGLALGFGMIFLLNWLLSRFNRTVIYLIIVAIGFAGVFYCTTSDYYTGYGLMIGFLIGTVIEKKYVKFANTKIWWRIVLRVLVAGGLYIGLNALIKLPFNSLIYSSKDVIYDNMIVFERIFRIVRYTIIVALVIGVYPMLFGVMDKVYRKWGWIKEPSDTQPSTEAVVVEE